MMPLSLAPIGEEHIVIKLGGNDKAKRHLADLGFTPGEAATVVSALGGNLIVKIRDTRVAISCEMAAKIMV